jgi:CheY-like chemotaxis protein
MAFAVVVSDLRMPGMDGATFLAPGRARRSLRRFPLYPDRKPTTLDTILARDQRDDTWLTGCEVRQKER